MKQLSEIARQAAREAGFELCGVASLRGAGFPELEYFSSWIKAGYAGEMEYLKSRDEQGKLKRASLQTAVPWARSVIVCGINYNTAQPYSTEVAHDKTRGWIARYAWSAKDYHDSVMRKLRQVETRIRSEAENAAEITTRCYVDTGPLVERVYAKYAGIGWIGKNTCILNQQLGSWIFLGVILASLDLEPDLPAPDRCGSCTRCIEACPTAALVEPYKLDATRCISYLTIEKRGEIPEEMRSGMGNHIFGCDICQDVCPWNGGASRHSAKAHSPKTPATQAVGFQPRPGLVNPPLEKIASMTREDFQKTFRGSPVKRAKYAGLRRNAVIAMGNSGKRSFLPQLHELTQDPDADVAKHARWAIQKLGVT
ncbi:MAG TPA: tRNA epoxyqueuosine(34) reductase QueG [Terriglobales bacterium]|nr:tRNA epoxyqueuosine(34) reductase QueG [Terriglobales bacterium]